MYDPVCGVSGDRNTGTQYCGWQKEVKLFGEPIEIRASIKKLEGLSGHADKNGLIGWLQKFEKSRTECLSYMVKMQSVLHLPSA